MTAAGLHRAARLERRAERPVVQVIQFPAHGHAVRQPGHRDVHARQAFEVMTMLKDVERLDDRVGKLQSHFSQATEDVRQIRISTDKVAKRGERIVDLQIEEAGEEAETEALTQSTQRLPVD